MEKSDFWLLFLFNLLHQNFLIWPFYQPFIYVQCCKVSSLSVRYSAFLWLSGFADCPVYRAEQGCVLVWGKGNVTFA